MKVELNLESGMRLAGKNESGQITYFDASEKHGGNNTAASPMEIFLQAMGACSSIDVIGILRKKRKTINSFKVFIDGIRADDFPKVFTDVKIIYEVNSPDVKKEEVEYAVKLSYDKYCSAMAMFVKSGCKIETVCKVIN